MKKLKILYVVGQLEIGGVELQLLELVKHINKSKFEIIICCLSEKTSLLKEFEKYCKVIILKKILPIDITRISRIIRITKENNIDIVHNDVFPANFYGAIAGKFAKKPTIISYKQTQKNYLLKARIIDFFLSKLADKILVISESIKQMLVKKAFFSKNKLIIIKEGINFNDYRIKKIKKIKVIGTAGRLVIQKNHFLFLDAAKLVLEKYPKIRFIVAGNGSLKEQLIKHSKNLKIEKNVFFLGEIRNMKRFYSKIDLFLLTSSYEGTPIVILEAIASNVPVIATNIPGTNEIIQNNKTGFLTEENAEKIAEKLIYLIENPEIAKKTAKQARNKLKKKYSIKRKVKEMQELYQTLMKQDKK